MWKQSRCKKGSRPLDRVSECSSSVVEGIDEGIHEDIDLGIGLGMDEGMDEGADSLKSVQEQNLEWVDERSRQTWVRFFTFKMYINY